MRSRTLQLLTLVATLVLFAAACGGSDDGANNESALAGYERTPAPEVGSITLPAANRTPADFTFQADPDELLMVTFGYSSCPDICPTTLADSRLALSQLGDRAAAVALAFVSIDPERDTDDVLTNYVEAFIDDGIAVRTDDADALALAADAFGVTYFVGENDAGDLEVAHTPHVFLVDDQGSMILTWPFGTTADDMASDLDLLLDRQQA